MIGCKRYTVNKARNLHGVCSHYHSGIMSLNTILEWPKAPQTFRQGVEEGKNLEKDLEMYGQHHVTVRL
jgi:hypothetical protein